jgi:hypothetical protein
MCEVIILECGAKDSHVRCVRLLLVASGLADSVASRTNCIPKPSLLALRIVVPWNLSSCHPTTLSADLWMNAFEMGTE